MSRPNHRYHLALTFMAVMSLALPTQASSDNQTFTSRVANANKAKECDFPPVAYVKGCTGTLIHPEIVIYAWHCGRPSSVKFAESGGSRKGFSVRASCKTVPGGRTNSKDWAYCKLAKPVKEIPIVPVVAGCEYEMISKAGQEVVQVGFGKTHNTRAGTKHWGISEVTEVSGGVVTVGDKNSVVACPGDSGGPLMVRMKDKSWRTIGILSTYNGRCGKGGVNWYADVQKAISWIEEDSGVDVTPCFNKEGKWEPGPDCGGFYAGDAGDAKGTWANKCEGTPRSGRSSTCGPADGGDDEKPKATILTPEDGDIVGVGKAIKVKVEAKDNEKVASVELFVDGDSQGSKNESPYTWEVEGLKSGTIEVHAVATDEAGNKGKSKVIEVEIKDKGEDAENDKDDPDEDGDDSASDGESDKSDKSDKGDKGDKDDEDDEDDEDAAESEDDEDAAENEDDDGKRKGCAVNDNTTGFAWVGMIGILVGFRRRW